MSDFIDPDTNQPVDNVDPHTYFDVIINSKEPIKSLVVPEGFKCDENNKNKIQITGDSPLS